LTNQSGLNEFQMIPNAEADAYGLLECPVVALRAVVIYPDVITPISIRSPRAMAAIQAGLLKKQTVIGLAQRDPSATDAEPEDLYTIGTEMALGRVMRVPDDSRSILVQGRRRVEIVEVIQTDPYIIAKARPLVETNTKSDETQAAKQTVLNMFRRAADLNLAIPEDVMTHTLNVQDAGQFADLVIAALMLPFEQRQRLL
jgi:ATP-dependent Lon protease